MTVSWVIKHSLKLSTSNGPIAQSEVRKKHTQCNVEEWQKRMKKSWIYYYQMHQSQINVLRIWEADSKPLVHCSLLTLHRFPFMWQSILSKPFQHSITLWIINLLVKSSIWFPIGHIVLKFFFFYIFIRPTPFSLRL